MFDGVIFDDLLFDAEGETPEIKLYGGRTQRIYYIPKTEDEEIIILAMELML